MILLMIFILLYYITNYKAPPPPPPPLGVGWLASLAFILYAFISVYINLF